MAKHAQPKRRDTLNSGGSTAVESIGSPKALRADKVCVIGLGHVGLPTAALMAKAGYRVVGVDTNRRIVDGINRGNIPTTEADIERLVKVAVKGGRLHAVAEPEPADVFIIAVPTPGNSEHHADLRHVHQAVASLAPQLVPGNIILLESTCPIGSTFDVSRLLETMRPDLSFPTSEGPVTDIHIAYCPERVLPGRSAAEVLGNDRIIGGITPTCASLARDIYSSFIFGECFLTDARTAEMTKLAENAFRDVNIAFANELSLLCEKNNVDVWEVIELANRHPRVEILRPGPGVGGHCVAVDPWFLIQASPAEATLIRAARAVNDAKPAHVVRRILEAAESYDEPAIACLGLSFKANIGDLRESPAIKITQSLAAAGIGRILAVEPNISVLPDDLRALNVTLCAIDNALAQADVVVLLVDHDEFLTIGCHRLLRKCVIDTRGIWRDHFPMMPAACERAPDRRPA